MLASELTALDLRLAQSVNGVGGSAHAPTNQGAIGGAGLIVTGPTLVAYGGTLVATSTSAPGITLGDNDHEQYGPGHVGRTRVRLEPLVSGQPAGNTDALFQAYYNLVTGSSGSPPVPTYATSFPWASPTVWRSRWVDTGLQALASSVDFSDGLGQRTMSWRSPLRAYDASTLSSIVVTLRVKTPHTQLPTVMPRVRVIRTESFTQWAPVLSHVIGDIVIPLASPNGFFYLATAVSPGGIFGPNGGSGSTEPVWPKTIGATVVDSRVTWTCQGTCRGNGSVVPLTSVAAGADANGFVPVPTPTSAFAWVNQQQPQTLTIPCDQNNVIAIGSYTYAAELVEEQGLTGYPLQLTCKQPVVTSAFTSIPLYGVQGVDGVTVGNNAERVLVAGGTVPGGYIWQANDPVSAGHLIATVGPSGQMIWRCTTPGITGDIRPFFPPQLQSVAQGGTAPWSATNTYALGVYVTNVDTSNLGAYNGCFYRCVAPGTSGSSPPVWPTTVGTTFSDGTVTWTCWGIASKPSVGSTVNDGTVVWTAVAPFTNIPACVPDMAANGIWIASTGAWRRAPDMLNASDFTQGMLIPIALGNSMAGTVVQTSSAITSWTPGVTPLNFTARVQDDDETPTNAAGGFFGHGIVWHSMLATYSGITDNHFE